MPSFLNVADFVKVGILAFIFIFFANKILDKFNLSEFKA